MTTLPKLRFLGHSERKKSARARRKVAVTAVAEDIVGDDAQVLTEGRSDLGFLLDCVDPKAWNCVACYWGPIA